MQTLTCYIYLTPPYASSRPVENGFAAFPDRSQRRHFLMGVSHYRGLAPECLCSALRPPDPPNAGFLHSEASPGPERLVFEVGSLRVVPHFPMLKESNVRKGFVVHDQYSLLRDALPDYLKPVLAMGYYTGMRQGEILSLRWEQVSFRDSQVLLDPGTTKNDEPRIVPLTGDLRAILEMQFDRHKLECPQCPFVFFYQGSKIGVFRKVWRNTCVRLGLARFVCVHCGKSTVGTKQCAPCSKLGKQNKQRYEGLLFHDLRRTGVRNLVRAGVPERVAMDVSGHKTRAVFDRYNIVNERDLKDAAQKLSRYLSAEFGHSSGIGAIRKGKPELEENGKSFSGKEKDWLGDLDSNQDSQIQSLESYQLDDLPTD
jgi:hypothetical protein